MKNQGVARGAKVIKIKEALPSLEAPFWKDAINNKIESIMHNHTRELADLSPRNKPLDCK